MALLGDLDQPIAMNNPSSRGASQSRPLICFIGTLRALELTADHLKSHLIDALDADVLICASRLSDADEATAELLSPARIVDCCLYGEANGGYEELCDSISASRLGHRPTYPWRQALKIEGNWMGGVNGVPGSGMHLNYNYYKLKQQLRSEKILSKGYTHFIITRTDFEWLAPHPSLDLLDDHLIWIPEGENYHGYNDRHAVCSRKNVDTYLGFFDDLITGKALTYLHKYKSLNHEYQLKLYLDAKGKRVGRFKNLAYLTGLHDTPSNCAKLVSKEIDGKTYFCKYPAEVDSSTFNSRMLAHQNHPEFFIIKPHPWHSRLPLWKARIRSLNPFSLPTHAK